MSVPGFIHPSRLCYLTYTKAGNVVLHLFTALSCLQKAHNSATLCHHNPRYVYKSTREKGDRIFTPCRQKRNPPFHAHSCAAFSLWEKLGRGVDCWSTLEDICQRHLFYGFNLPSVIDVQPYNLHRKFPCGDCDYLHSNYLLPDVILSMTVENSLSGTILTVLVADIPTSMHIVSISCALFASRIITHSCSKTDI